MPFSLDGQARIAHVRLLRRARRLMAAYALPADLHLAADLLRHDILGRVGIRRYVHDALPAQVRSAPAAGIILWWPDKSELAQPSPGETVWDYLTARFQQQPDGLPAAVVLADNTWVEL